MTELISIINDEEFHHPYSTRKKNMFPDGKEIPYET